MLGIHNLFYIFTRIFRLWVDKFYYLLTNNNIMMKNTNYLFKSKSIKLFNDLCLTLGTLSTMNNHIWNFIIKYSSNK